MTAVVVKQIECGAYSGTHILKEWKRQEKEGIPLYDLLKMGKLGALTQKEPAREQRGKTSITSFLGSARISLSL